MKSHAPGLIPALMGWGGMKMWGADCLTSAFQAPSSELGEKSLSWAGRKVSTFSFEWLFASSWSIQLQLTLEADTRARLQSSTPNVQQFSVNFQSIFISGDLNFPGTGSTSHGLRWYKNHLSTIPDWYSSWKSNHLGSGCTALCTSPSPGNSGYTLSYCWWPNEYEPLIYFRSDKVKKKSILTPK